jgi:hypothetical protein
MYVVEMLLFCSGRKLRWVLTNRLIKFFIEQSKRDPEKYLQFYDDYGIFFREGIVTTPEQEQRVGFVNDYNKILQLWHEPCFNLRAIDFLANVE